MGDRVYIPLCECLSRCEGVFPSKLKMSKLISPRPLFKAGDREEPASYRPICIFSVESHRHSYFESNNMFSTHQFGYRSGMFSGDVVRVLSLQCWMDFSGAATQFTSVTQGRP